MDRKRRAADSVSKNRGAGKRSAAEAPERSAKPKKTPVRGSPGKKPLARDSKNEAPPRRARIEAPAIRYEPGRPIDSEAALAEAAAGLHALDADFIRRLVEV